MADLAQLTAWRDALMAARYRGIRTVEYDGKRVTYASDGEMAAALMDEGVYVTAFSYPVVPKEKARIRTQMCAGHTDAQVDEAVTAFVKVGKCIGVI